MGEFPLLYSFFEFDGFLSPSQPVRLTAPSSKGARQGENVFFPSGVYKTPKLRYTDYAKPI